MKGTGGATIRGPAWASLGRGHVLSREGRKMAVVQRGPEAPRDGDPEGSVLGAEWGQYVAPSEAPRRAGRALELTVDPHPCPPPPSCLTDPRPHCLGHSLMREEDDTHTGLC